MIITISGRAVKGQSKFKRSQTVFVPARGRRTLCGGVPVLTRQAKAPAPWANVRYSLTEAGAASGLMEAGAAKGASDHVD